MLKVRNIVDIEGMKSIENLWNAFIIEQGKSPFLLSGFINQSLEHRIENLKPFYIVFFEDDKIVGVVPVGIRDIGFRYCRLLLGRDFQPELIFNSRYKEVCLKKTFDILFRKMNCQFVDLFLPVEHPHLSDLNQICKVYGIHSAVSPDSSRAIISVDSSWRQFEKDRRHLRREFERSERRMNEIGRLRTRWFGKDSGDELFKNILRVESASWKKSYRSRIGLKVDPVLSFIYHGCMQTSLTVSDFDWGVAFLELNEKPIAYSLFLKHKGHAYICKTSFDDRFRKQGAGVYVNHVVVRELMSRSNVDIIDFMTDLPFSHKWASKTIQVNRLRLWQRGVAPFLFRSILSSSVTQTAIASGLAQQIIGVFYK